MESVLFSSIRSVDWTIAIALKRTLSTCPRNSVNIGEGGIFLLSFAQFAIKGRSNELSYLISPSLSLVFLFLRDVSTQRVHQREAYGTSVSSLYAYDNLICLTSIRVFTSFSEKKMSFFLFFLFFSLNTEDEDSISVRRYSNPMKCHGEVDVTKTAFEEVPSVLRSRKIQRKFSIRPLRSRATRPTNGRWISCFFFRIDFQARFTHRHSGHDTNITLSANGANLFTIHFSQ